MEEKNLDLLTGKILDVAITVHRYLGPGSLESIYEKCTLKEFEMRGINAKNQVVIPVIYKGIIIPGDFRVDILVENQVILELKSSEIYHPVYEAQIISYLRLSNKRVGFLINFNVPLLKDGIKRFVNNY
jgi:GxxExxY protein